MNLIITNSYKNNYLTLAKMKNQFLKCLYAFIIMMMFPFSVINAQIVYTDIIPDATYTCHVNNSSTKTYQLDLNNDSTNDFNIVCFSTYAHIKILRVSIAPQGSNFYITNSTNTVKKNLCIKKYIKSIQFCNYNVVCRKIWPQA